MMETLWIGLQLLTLYSCFPGSKGNEQFIVPETYRCACSNTVLTFECITDGSGQTLWNGTAFNCENKGNQIILSNSAFSSAGAGSIGTCSDNIVARGIKVDGRCHTSQLNVTVTSSGLNQTSIVCHSSTQVGRAVLTVLLNHYPPPRNVVITSTSSEKITFTWNSMAPACSSIHYLITASNCGVCPQTVSNTTAACTNLQPTTEIRECRFSVQNVVCSVMGNPSEPATERIGVPTISKLVVVPRFMSSNRKLLSLEGFSGSVATLPVTGFDVSFLTPSGASISSESIANPCLDPNCAIDVLPLCSSFPSINFTVSAENVFGQGPPSNINTIGCSNEFVNVEYDPRSSILLCNFTMVDISSSVKSCNVSYKMCEDTRTENLMNSSTSNLVTLTISLSPGMYCFQVEAVSNNLSIIVEGSWNINKPNGARMSTVNLGTIDIIEGIFGCIITVLAIIITVTTVIIFVHYKRMKAGSSEVAKEQKIQVNGIEVTLKLLRWRTADYEMVLCKAKDSDTDLKHCVVETIGPGVFRRGCAFYEFIHEVECVSQDKELLFVKDAAEDNQLFQQLECDEENELKLIGDKVSYPKLEPQNFKLFVQSKGSGRRHVPADSFILYKRFHKDRKPDTEPEDRPNMPILSWQEQFMIKKVNTSCNLKQFCADNSLEADKIFVNYDTSNTMSPYLHHLTDVIVQFKGDNKRAFTGPSARRPETLDPNTMVFIFNRQFPANLPLTKNAQIICQNPKQKSSKAYFHVLKVNKDQDNKHMLAFIKEEFGDDAFVNGSTFCEFSDTEDLLYYKEVLHVRMTKEELDAKVGQQICSEVDSDISYFYEISGAPGLNIKPPQENGYQVFLQSTSQGSRCLKANSLLLYKISRNKELFIT